ncbi:MAG TPA: hypothetical protein VGK73_39425 [Polyangiaceae bacterium]
MRIALVVAALSLLGGAGFLLYRSTQAARASAGTSAAGDDRELRREVEALRAELRVLSARREQSSPLPAQSAPSPASSTVDGPTIPVKLRLKDVVAHMPPNEREAYLHRLQKLETKRRVELTEAQIAAEPRDSLLQAKVEGEVQAALALLDTREFSGTRLSSVECGSTLCMIEVDQDSPSEHEAFSGRFNLDRRTFAVRRGGESDEPGQRRGWTVFVTAPGKRLPRAELEELVALLPPE